MAVSETASQPATGKIREAVGVFHDAKTLQAAVDELLSSGFDYSELSLLASENAVEKKLGHVLRKVTEAEDNSEVPRTAFVAAESIGEAEGGLIGGLFYVGAVAAAGAVVATGGTLGAAILGAVVAGGAGGVIGSVLARWLGKHHAHFLQEQLDRGGLLLWVRTPDSAHEQRATEILKRHSAEDVHVHDLPHVRYEFKGGVSYDMSFMNALGL